MRLWSIHPRYLDTRGLVALWRESLLAQEVLTGSVRAYRNHPQLIRFKDTSDAAASIAAYLKGVLEEATKRGFNFDAAKIKAYSWYGTIPVNRGQLEYEFRWLLKKLAVRDAMLHGKLTLVDTIEPHPLFTVRSGGIEPWERVKE